MMDDIEMRVADALITKQADRIEALENTLRQAREALAVMKRSGDVFWYRNETAYAKACEALAAIDAVLSGAPPSEITDGEIWGIAIANNLAGADVGSVLAFARAVLKEGK